MALAARTGWTRLFNRSPLLLVALSLLIAGCGRSVSKGQFDRIRLGMSVADVEDILGKGNIVESGEVDKLVKSSAPADGAAAKAPMDTSEMRGVKWGDDKKSITVIYKNEKVFRVFSQGLQ
jgi:hypothetical protein